MDKVCCICAVEFKTDDELVRNQDTNEVACKSCHEEKKGNHKRKSSGDDHNGESKKKRKPNKSPRPVLDFKSILCTIGNGVEVKKAEDNSLGLFVNRDFKKNEFITLLDGKLVAQDQAEEGKAKERKGIVYKLQGTDMLVKGFCSLNEALKAKEQPGGGSFVQAPKGKNKANSKFVVITTGLRPSVPLYAPYDGSFASGGNVVVLKAMADIPAGTELRASFK